MKWRKGWIGKEYREGFTGRLIGKRREESTKDDSEKDSSRSPVKWAKDPKQK